MDHYGRNMEKSAGKIICDIITERYGTLSKFREDYINSTGENISQATITNITRGEKTVSLCVYASIAKFLNINLFSMLAQLEEKSSVTINFNNFEDIFLKHIFNQRKTFEVDAENINFDGYRGSFHTYFYQTIANKDDLLHGVLTMDKADNANFMKADFTLYYYEDGEKKEKNYEGYLIYSYKTHVITCILFSDRLGEICMLKFSHLPLQNNKLACRVAEAITTSAGSQRVPTVHRVYISRKELTKQQQDDVKGHLLLNSSRIIVSAKSLLEFLASPPAQVPIPEHFKKALEGLVSETNYIKIEETELFKNKSHITKDEIAALGALFKISENARYNKISYKVDERTYSFYKSVPLKKTDTPLEEISE